MMDSIYIIASNDVMYMGYRFKVISDIIITGFSVARRKL